MPKIYEKVGAIVEFDLGDYLAYGVCSHAGDSRGDLIRLAHGKFRQRPLNLGELVRQPELRSVFFFLGKSGRSKGVSIIGRTELAEYQKPFPHLRDGGWRLKDGRRLGWREIIGGVSVPVTTVSEEFKKLSDATTWNIGNLKLIYENDLTPERQFKMWLEDLHVVDPKSSQFNF